MTVKHKDLSQDDAHDGITLSSVQEGILIKLVNASTTSKALSKRASIILALASRSSKYQMVKDLNVSWPTINKWERRWLEMSSTLHVIENQKPLHELKSAIIELLKDASRPGAPCTFTQEQVTQIMALACSSPENEGLPFSHWSCRLLAEHARRAGIVKQISFKQVSNFLKSGGY